MSATISDVFGALADETRRALYERLLDAPNGETATELAADASISRQAIVKHLQVLTRTGLATTQRSGREVRYVVTRDGTSGATTWLVERARTWDRRLATLEERIRVTPRAAPR